MTSAHPERHDHNNVAHSSHSFSRRNDKCTGKIEQRRDAALKSRLSKVGKRDTRVSSLDNYKYSELPNKTCLLAPDTIFGPYDVDGELHRHDVREGQEVVNLYLDLGLIDVETCEPLPDAWLNIWVCRFCICLISYLVKDRY